MSISAPFIRRPIATSLLSLAILMAGALAHRFLPVAALPQVEFPTISVNANLPGASPETMASAVATPLERQFGRIAAISEMTSTSWSRRATSSPAPCSAQARSPPCLPLAFAWSRNPCASPLRPPPAPTKTPNPSAGSTPGSPQTPSNASRKPSPASRNPENQPTH